MSEQVRRTPLIDAVCANDLRRVRALLDAGVDVDGVDDQNDTALAWAISRSSDEVIGALLDAGATMDGNRGFVALQALKRETPQVARMFARHGFDWGMDGERHDPPKFGEYRHALFYALAHRGGWSGSSTPWALDFLALEVGVSLDVLGAGDEMTALQYAATSILDPAQDCQHSVCRLIELGADPVQLLGVPLDELLPRQVVEFAMAAITSGEIAKSMNSGLKNVYKDCVDVHNSDEDAHLTGISESSISHRVGGLMI